MVGENCPVSVASADEAREAVTSGRLERLIGSRECEWLDVKKEPYKLGNPASDIELLKDVGALANAVGGVLMIGFDTVQHYGREVVGELRPVPVGSVNAERYRKLLRERVFPLVRGLRVQWVAVDEESGVLAIDVPEQSESDKPFVVPGRNDAEGFSLPIRDDDGTLWLSRESAQRLLSVGWNAQGGIDREAILDLIRHVQNSSASAPEPTFQIGQDAPSVRKAFEEAWAAAGGAVALGLPSGPTERIGPGLVQHLASGAVVCAIEGYPAVVVSEGVWETIARIGARAKVQGAMALGFPDLPATANLAPADSHITMIDERPSVIALAGGSWGSGRLRRPDPGATWSWEPEPRIDFLMLSNMWATSDPVDLRVRAVATLPFASGEGTSPPRIDRNGRSRLEAALRHGATQ